MQTKWTNSAVEFGEIDKTSASVVKGEDGEEDSEITRRRDDGRDGSCSVVRAGPLFDVGEASIFLADEGLDFRCVSLRIGEAGDAAACSLDGAAS